MAVGDDVRELLELGRLACRAYHRDDLAEQLEALGTHLEGPGRTVLVAGEYKQGKSSLVGALTDTDVCPVDDDIATAVPTLVRHAAQTVVEVVWVDGTRSDTTVAAVRELLTESGNPRNERGIRQVEVGVDRPVLAGGLVLVDTPGAAGLTSTLGTTAAAVPHADAVLFVSDASQDITASELAFLQGAVDRCPLVLLVVTKTDLYPRWRDTVQRNQAHLAAAGLAVDVVGASSQLYLSGLHDGDLELLEESHVPVLLEVLQATVVAAGEAIAVRAVAQAVGRAAEQMAAVFRAELAGLAGADAEVAAERAQLRETVERFRSTAGRWSVALGDGFSDVTSAVDYDLRRRIRAVVDEGEERLDDLDPARSWDTFEPWLYARVAEELSAAYVAMAEQVADVEAAVAALFAAFDEGEVVAADLSTSPEAALEQLAVRAHLKLATQPRLLARAMTGLRGGYSGTLMFSSLGALASVTLAAPALVGLGLLTGARALRDDRERALAQRRQQAKQSLRKYMDEVSSAIAKDQRDSLRRVQRELRDGFQQRAESLQRSLQEREQALDAGSAGAKAAATTARRADIDAELGRLADLASRAQALSARGGAR